MLGFFSKLACWAVDRVLGAEKSMSGKSGKEKRAAVVSMLDAMIPLPQKMEGVDDAVIGEVVDWVCDTMNWLTDYDFSKTELDEAQKEKVAAVSLNASVASVEDVKEKSVEERLNALYEKYGIKPEPQQTLTPPAPGGEYDEAVKDVYGEKSGDLSRHFSRKEFVCHCGCGAFIHVPELIEKLEKFRELCGGKATNIGSGTRCFAHNKAVGGAMPDEKKGTKGSQHLYGKAADIRKYPDMTVDEMVKKAEEAGFDGIGAYNWGIHVDVRGTKARWDYRGK